MHQQLFRTEWPLIDPCTVKEEWLYLGTMHAVKSLWVEEDQRMSNVELRIINKWTNQTNFSLQESITKICSHLLDWTSGLDWWTDTKIILMLFIKLDSLACRVAWCIMLPPKSVDKAYKKKGRSVVLSQFLICWYGVMTIEQFTGLQTLYLYVVLGTLLKSGCLRCNISEKKPLRTYKDLH